MRTASTSVRTRQVSLASRIRARLVQITAAGALIGCLCGGFAFSSAAMPLTSAHAVSASHALAGVQVNTPCGAVPFPC